MGGRFLFICCFAKLKDSWGCLREVVRPTIPFCPQVPALAAERSVVGEEVGKGQMGAALMGSLRISSFLTEGLFGYPR